MCRRRDNARTVGSNEAGLRANERAPNGNHVLHGDALGDADHQRDSGILGFQDRVSSTGRGHKNDADIRVGLTNSLLNRVEDRDLLEALAAATRRDTGDDVGAEFDAPACVLTAFCARNALNEQSGARVH